jgi:predicted ATPase
MLTRLKVSGFKNLDGLDVRLGPFTCIAGPNGVGKSNFFDAIHFLSALADKPLLDAALLVRGGEGRGGDVRNLFTRAGDQLADEMSFLVEMIIPAIGEDALGQKAKASITYLQYELKLRYRADMVNRALGGIELVSERMGHINRSDAGPGLGFRHSKAWRNSALEGRRTSPFISTEMEDGIWVVRLHADAGEDSGGRPRRVPASSLPRTMLSSVNNASEHRTLVLARQEMMTWIQLQLEPSALRAPDGFMSPHVIGANGAHVPATLYHLFQLDEVIEENSGEDVYQNVANRLAELIENVESISVDVDEKRQALNIMMTDRQGASHLASALSDGTLRFIALTVMEADTAPRALLCLEEPENGMHPQRIPAMIRLLQDLAVDTEEPVGPTNPLRQVIINTHSPSVVAEVPDDSLLLAQGSAARVDGKSVFRFGLLPLPDTWRTKLDPSAPSVARGVMLDYLNPIQATPDIPGDNGISGNGTTRPVPGPRRVKDRKDLQLLLPNLLLDQ